MTQSLFRSFWLIALLTAFVLPSRAGEIIDGDPADGSVDPSAVNNTQYYEVYDVVLGNPPGCGGACNMIEAFPLPYLAPGQTVSAATISFYLDSGGSNQSSVDYNVQLYGLNRVSVPTSVPLSNPAPILADYYAGKNDTANTLLSATFIPTAPTLSKTYSYSGSNLATFINNQYANTAFASLGITNNRYVYFRLSPDTVINDGAKFDQIASARNPNRAFHPLLALTISGGITNTAGKLQFSFNLPQNSQGSYVTSAGVYNPTTGALLRTLWNNVQYQSGTNYGFWDGKDDSGNVLTTGTNYQIKLIYHNVQYIWQGMVGNTSAAQVGSNVFASFEKIHDMTFSGTMGYYAVGYNENGAEYHKFVASTPQVPQEMGAGGIVTDSASSMTYVTSDATKTYWAKTPGGFSAANTFVIGVNNSDNSLYTFPQGTVPPHGPGQYASVVDFDNTANQANYPAGVAVQQGATGDLFVSHRNLNLVRAFDKVQGNLLGTFTVASPGRMATAPNGDVWVISYGTSPSVARYTFSGGKATLDQTITGFSNPEGVGVSPDGTLLLVADGGTSMQVKAFTNTTGVVGNTSTPLWTYGTQGGMSGPLLTTNSFDFNVQVANTSNFGTDEAFVAFKPDGTFWLEDGGNSRYLHFSINGSTLTYIEQITYNDCSYQSTVDLSDATRVFNQFTEYSVNYSLPLGGTNGSWKMVNNWAIGLPSDATHAYFGQYNGWINVVTLSNGRTYGFLNNFNNNNSQDLFELSPTGPARFTGYQFTTSPLIYADGSLRYNVSNGLGSALTYYSAPLTGFDANNNPVWATPAMLASTTLSATTPLPLNTYPMRTEITASGILIDFDGNHFDTSYHIAGLALGSTAFKWQASPTSTGTYWFPQDGHFDVGNGVQYAGNYAGVVGRNIVYGYHGELWAGGEASQWVNYLDNGLMVGRFGTYGNINSLTGATPGFAGNSFFWSLLNGPDGNVYLYHGDEANHGGTNRWLISGWNAISELNGTAAVGSTVNLNSSTSGPSVTMTSPLNGTADPNGSSLTLSAQAASNGAAITSVQFMDGTNSLGTVNISPFMLNYTGLAAGSHTITAVATDANGLSTTSAPVNITISGDGTSAPPPSPTSLSTANVTAQSVTLNWTEPAVGTASSTIGKIISFQSAVSGGTNALAPTAVAGVAPYAVADFNLLGVDTGSAIQLNVLDSTGTTVANLGVSAGIATGATFNTGSALTGTAAKLYGSVALTHSTGLSFSLVPYTNYDLVVYSAPGTITSNSSTTLTLIQGLTTSVVTQNFTAPPAAYTVAKVAFGTPSTTTTNMNTIVFQGLNTPFFMLSGANIAGYQIVERPLDQGTPTSYQIQRATGTSGAFATIGTASGSATSFTDTSSLNASTTYQYRILAVNSFGTSANPNTVTVTTPASAATSTTNFTSWQSKYFTAEQLADPTISGPTADPYGSGVPNLLAYALQLDPSTARPTDVPSPVITNGHLTVTYFVPSSISDISYIVEVSSDLQAWNSGSGYTQVLSSVPSSTGTTITVQDVTSAATQKHFMRLRVTQNP